MSADGPPVAVPAQRGKWAVAGRAPLQIPIDPWNEQTLVNLRGVISHEAEHLVLDLSINPRAILDDPVICKLPLPLADKLFHADVTLQ